ICPSASITFINPSALRLLGLSKSDGTLVEVVPDFAELFDALRSGSRESAQEELRMTRRGKMENLLVRMAKRRDAEGNLDGYVVAFDDVTELVSAQRMAAWGDVARRIAHEIKNPLTPIKLSAQRLQRKFDRQIEEDKDEFIRMTDVIVRQTEDLQRIVDEFSKFARMPEPTRKLSDLSVLIRDAVTLQTQSLGQMLVSDLPAGPVMADIDETLIGQALTNLIKNAGEAIETLQENGTDSDYQPQVRVEMTLTEQHAIVRIADNGVGLPANRARLFEPYVTTRDKGTGLGLSIVKKIIEEHGGTLELTDAPIFDGNTHHGALAEITLPRVYPVQEAAE
ncbi:MAG: ATP-binding protein, partial [Pseudomonadota bacterium]